MKQEPWEIQEIIESLKGRKVLSSCAPGLTDTDSHDELSSMASVSQGGNNSSDIVRLELLEGDWHERDHEQGEDKYGELWLIGWDVKDRYFGYALVVFEK